MKKNNIIIVTSLLYFLLSAQTYAQVGLQGEKSFENGVNYLSILIADSIFKQNFNNDLEAVDYLYNKALDFYEGDISEALLTLTFATLPFNKMNVKIPLIKNKIPLNLPSVNDSLFLKKRANLPKSVLFNSTKNNGYDKDKVAHFFGNAFLSYNISVFNLSKFFGLFVEMFESAFKVSSGVDVRDIYANYLGEYFGYSLRHKSDLKPSDFFKVYSLFYFSYN